MSDLQTKLLNLGKRLPDQSEALLLAFNYIEPDPASSLTKSRTVLEKLVVEAYKHEMCREPRKPLLGDVLTETAFTKAIERRILSRMHSIRDMANLGPHGEVVVPSDAARVLEDLCTVLEWFLVQYPAQKRHPSFVHPDYREWYLDEKGMGVLREAKLPPGYCSIACSANPFPLREPPRGKSPAYLLHIANFTSLQDLLDDVYCGFLQDRFPPRTYGSTWVLACKRFRRLRLLIPVDWLFVPEKTAYRLDREWTTSISPEAAGIIPGTDLWILDPAQCRDPLGLAVMDPLLIEIVELARKDFTVFERLLERGDRSALTRQRFSHTAVIHGGAELFNWGQQRQQTWVLVQRSAPISREELEWRKGQLLSFYKP
jgi:hypothetical protein